MEWLPDRHLRVDKFVDYKPRSDPPSSFAGGKISYVDRIDFTFIPDPSAQVAALRAASVDFAEIAAYDVAATLEKEPNLTLYIPKPGHLMTIVFNLWEGPFKDVRLRRAVKLAIDPKEVMASVGPSKFWRATPDLFFADTPWASTVRREVFAEVNLDKAKALVKEAGYEGTPIKGLNIPTYQRMYNVGLVAAEAMRRIGLNVALRDYEWATAVGVFQGPDKSA